MSAFIEHFTGNIEIIISIPHGGSLAPKSLPNRKCKCANKNHEKCPVVWVSDDLTIDLGLEIAKAIREHCGGDPHIVINHLWRPKLDPNREITIGAQEHFTAIQAFKRYHGIIENTKATFKRGLLIDLHGNSKDNGVTEIGYCLPKMNLISNDFDIKQSSIGTLAMENPHLDLITGRYSFGDFVEAEGIPAVPSSQNPKPGIQEVYFSGGYITRHHCNHRIDAIQVETPTDLRLRLQRFGQALGKAISDFYIFHYCS
eukprot:09606.XXX_249145_251935_1 [CDS] Oithona nana genome sequencing.